MEPDQIDPKQDIAPDQIQTQTWDQILPEGDSLNFVQNGNTISPIAGSITSPNFKTGSVGWSLDSAGNLEANTGTFRGALVANSLDIPNTTTANSFHVDTAGNAWWGATTLGSAVASITKAGLGTFSNIAITGGSVSGASIASIPNSTATDISLLDATHDLVFSVTDADTVAWASGTITLSTGRTFAISAGNTGNMVAKTYIYLSTADSLTVLQTTTIVATAMGANKKLIAVAQNGNAQAQYIVYGGIGGLKLPASSTSISNNNWAFSGVWSITDLDTIAWGAGTLTTSDGGSYSITGSNTGNMAAKTYVYFDLAVSSTAFQTTTTAATSVGDGKILIAICQNGAVEATFMVMNDKQTNIDAANIAAGSITANEIATGTITADRMSVSQLSAIAADLGSITAGTIVMPSGGFIRSGQTAYRTGTGFWLGNVSGTPKFSIGVANTGPEMIWDGTNLQATNVQIIQNFNATENITTGNPVGISNFTGGVARAKRVISTASLGQTARNTVPEMNAYCPIGGDKFVMLLNAAAGSDTLYAQVGSIDTTTNTVTLGTALSVAAAFTPNTSDMNNACVCKLATDKFIVFYVLDASTTVIKYRVGTVSGTTITFGTEATATTAASTVATSACFSADFISTDKGIFIYKAATAADGRMLAFTTSGTVATFGSAVAMGTNTAANTAGSGVKTIATDKYVVATVNAANSLYTQVCTLSGTVITAGSEQQISTATGLTLGTYFQIVSPASNVYAVRWEQTSSSWNVIAATVATTTSTAGAVIASATSAQGFGGLYAASATSLYVTESESSQNNPISKLTLSGATLTNTGIVDQAFSSQSTVTGTIAMDNGYFVVVSLKSTTADIFIQGMANNFLGIAQNTATQNNTVNVLIKGVDANQSSLVAGSPYLVTSTGLTAVSTQVTVNTLDDIDIVKAISSTQVLL